MTILNREFDKETASVEFLEEFHREVLIEKAQLVRLFDFPGWKLYCEFVESNSTTLSKATHGAVFRNFGDVFSDQFAKGKAEGLRAAPKLYESILTLYDQALAEIQGLIKEKQNDSGTEHTSDDTGRGDDSSDTPSLFDSGSDQYAP
jgi:hypothetical protein